MHARPGWQFEHQRGRRRGRQATEGLTMGMTMSEKILARAGGRDSVRPGEMVLAERGLVLPGECVVGADSHSCTYGALNNYATGIGSTDLACVLALGELWFNVPPTLKFVYHNRLSEWVESKDLILHVIGMIGVDGARNKAMEHTGEALKHLDMEARLTMTNMAIEAGAKNGIMEFDEVTKDYLDTRAKRPYKPVTSDPDAEYEKVFEFDAEKVELGVAKPMSPDNYA